MSRTNPLLMLLVVVVVVSVANAEPGAATRPRLSPESQISQESQENSVRFMTDFPAGKIDQLIQRDEENFEVVIRPEGEPINDSAWYAFRVESSEERMINVRLRYEGGSHRYAPKMSRDRTHWESAAHLITAVHPGGREITLRLPVGEAPLWVAGQELVSNQDIRQWISRLSKRSSVDSSVIGESVSGRPIYQMEIGKEDASDAIFILSRQHPPEVTGTIGMMDFVDALCIETDLAREYRRQFRTVVVPIANPDGVARGYWRANANGVDLNRDWLQFSQPETQAIRAEILRQRRERTLWLFLDFHSTYNEVFYTLPKGNDLFPKGFTTEWLGAVNKRLPSFDVVHDDGHNSHRTTSKAWVARELGIHAITYEFGDETERDRIRRIAAGSAEEMMRLLLERKKALSPTTVKKPINDVSSAEVSVVFTK